MEHTIANTHACCIEPGGYLQWFDFEPGEFSQTKGDQYPRMTEIWHKYFDPSKSFGFSFFVPRVVRQECEIAGMKNVNVEVHKTLGEIALQSRVQEWVFSTISKIFYQVLLMSGNSIGPAEAQQELSKDLQEIRESFARGVEIDVRFGTVVAQAPSQDA